jgi:hypothetical protein
MSCFESQLKELKSQGFLLLKNALEFEHVVRWREILYGMYENGQHEVHNSVGNVAFEKLLALHPELSRDLIGHDSVARFLKFILGKQCQLRSLRAHVNPQSYLQEWHMDFYDYYQQKEKSQGTNPLTGLCVNTTFYLTDNPPARGRLRFLKDFVSVSVPKDITPYVGYTDDRKNPFQVWCDSQAYVDLHPNAGDLVIFYSHIPHQGAKLVDDPQGNHRANIVLHYQQNPMHPEIQFVSDPQFTLDTLGYADTFPFSC